MQRKLGVDFSNPKWPDLATNRIDMKVEIYVSTEYGEADRFVGSRLMAAERKND